MTTTSTAPPIATGPPPAVRPLPPVLLLLALAAHAPMALAMQSSRTLATAQAALTVAAVLWVLAAARTPGPLVAAAGYVAGCEVLWRQTQAAVPWEVGKYLLLLVFSVGIFRFVGRIERWGVVGLFLASLVPATVVPVVRLGFLGAVDPLSFNLAGLVALAAGVLFLSRVAGPWESVTPALWAFVAPVLGIATLAAASLRGLGARDFFNDSNLRSSGGFGPNQVSAVLGLAALFLVLIAVRERRVVLQVVALALGLWCTVQALLTFSRGGVVNLAVALLCALPFLLRRRETAARVLVIGLTVAIAGTVFILPRLDDYTGGALERRFSRSREEERRAELIQRDYETFTEHPGLGVGVGQSEFYRIERRLIASHTEYTRLLAEHGLLGIVALLCLAAMVVTAFRRQRLSLGQAWVAALVAWTALELSHSSTRLAAVAFTFALAQFAIVDASARPAARDAVPDAAGHRPGGSAP
ncbi:MAG: O-antigen ligase family protein [Acidimicrobiales bacterium]|nr:O-antigen ligase family protein [Acidimicrobiales bacterium]